MGIGHILRGIKREKVIDAYSQKDRLINSKVYAELKSKRKCDKCKKPFTHGAKPEIHHKIPRSKGGSNDIKNLMAVCHHCHKVLDAEELWMDERDEYYCSDCGDCYFITKAEWRAHIESHGQKGEDA